MSSFRAFRIHQDPTNAQGGVIARMERIGLEDLSPGEVVIRVVWSSINYKDALAATGAGKILRRYPLVAGIDLAGEVVSSQDVRYRSGQKVIVTGCGLSETLDGGYAEQARVPGDAVVPLPKGMSLRTAMALGTAGFTAALAIHRMEHNGQRPALGPIAVTGATGGVGALAIDILSARGYPVVAITGKAEAQGQMLRSLGAAEVLSRQNLQLGVRPLESAQWGGAIDNVGGEILSWLTRSTRPAGNVTSIGLAGSPALSTSVMPFILRGVNLLGISSSTTSRDQRLVVWERLATDLAPRHLERIVTRTIAFDALPTAFQPLIDGRHVGRSLVHIAEESA